MINFHHGPPGLAAVPMHAVRPHGHARPMSIADVVAHCASAERFPPCSFAVTFDDGYRDIHRIHHRRHQHPLHFDPLLESGALGRRRGGTAGEEEGEEAREAETVRQRSTNHERGHGGAFGKGRGAPRRPG